MTDERIPLERATSQLFGDRWESYDIQLFDESLQLFFKRLHLAWFDTHWFQEKTCYVRWLRRC